jgi:hypothetical protein
MSVRVVGSDPKFTTGLDIVTSKKFKAVNRDKQLT